MTLLAAGAAAKLVLTTLATMAVHATVLAVLALLLVRAGRLRPSWQAAIWLVVLAKFVLPWGPAMPWSLADLAALLEGGGHGGPIVIPAAADAAVVRGSNAAALAWLMLATVWAIGTASVVIRAVLAHREARVAACQAPAAPVWARELLADLSVRLSVRAPYLVIGPPDVGPHVVGVWSPVVVVPRALLDDRAVLRAALVHELAHLRRRDGLTQVIAVAARAVFFYWPVVRIAIRRFELARESACDAWALEAADIARPVYARLLVRMASLRSAAVGLARPAGLDARIAAVLGPPVRSRLGIVHAIALVAWIAIGLGGARTAEAAPAHEVCVFTPQIAEAMLTAYPEADRDGDGMLSREEACDYQAELVRRGEVPERGRSSAGEQVSELMPPLCCNCDSGDGLIPSSGLIPPDASCERSEGVEQ
ncbi:MAG: M56 family metallopeptidase [Kofleriaceae bacterium]